jgi:hypothetical protein
MSRSRLAFVLALVTAIAASCGSRDTSSPISLNEPLAECDDYVSAYRACFGNLSAETHRLTDDRARRLHDEFLASSRVEATRERTRVACVAGARQLKEACR